MTGKLWLSIVTGAIGVVACIHHPPPAPSSETAQLDSVQIIRLAAAALDSSPAVDWRTAYRVSEFVTDSTGATLVTFVPVPPPPGVIHAGGGGRVRVSKSGVARVVEVFQ